MLDRPDLLGRMRTALRRSPVVALLGPRQCGKTTAARWIVPADSERYFDLEDPASLRRLEEPMISLGSLRGTVVIDEVQRRPELFPLLRVLADRRPSRARFLILGSASPELLRQSSESLAGRLETISLSGLRFDEVGPAALERRWVRGGFPRSFLARSEADSQRWRADFVRTFLERDLAALGLRTPATTMLRLWTMIAHYHGSVWNAAEPARSLGVSEPTVRQYLDLLTSLYLVRQLVPWHANLKKRQVRAPKVYVRDTGLLHHLLGIGSRRELLHHPKLGASWEGFIVEELIQLLEPDDVSFWATHNGAELDLLVRKGSKHIGYEIKRQDAPTLTPSMRIAKADLKLDRLIVIHPGDRTYALAPGVTALPARVLAAGDVRAVTNPRVP